LLLLQVPPGTVFVNIVVNPTHAFAVPPVAAGAALTNNAFATPQPDDKE
jgi:hypothetical protein